MIDCVHIATAHCFPGNLIAAQHRLRYQEVIAKEDWGNIYVAAEMEFEESAARHHGTLTHAARLRFIGNAASLHHSLLH